MSAAAVLIKDKPIFLPERYICAKKGQDTQVSAAAVLIKDKPISNVFQYRTNCLNATPMFEYLVQSNRYSSSCDDMNKRNTLLIP